MTSIKQIEANRIIRSLDKTFGVVRFWSRLRVMLGCFARAYISTAEIAKIATSSG